MDHNFKKQFFLIMEQILLKDPPQNSVVSALTGESPKNTSSSKADGNTDITP